MAVNWRSQDLLQRARLGAQRGLVAAAEGVRSEAVSLILDGAKSGRIYRRRGVVHRASAPGEAPASDTGRLVNSIRTQYDMPALRATVLASTAYAAALEYGTYKMEARPYMRPALAARQRFISQQVANAVRAALGG